MHERGGRLFLGLCVLVLVWVGVYWVWEPGGASADALITFDERPPAAAGPEPIDAQAAVAPAVPEPAPGQSEPERVRAPSSEPSTLAVAPEFREYTVADGDTLERIAHREWGRASLWTAIAQANPLKDPTRLRAGEVIRIPLDPGNVQGRPSAGESVAGPRVPTPVTYTVARGDTLEKIARAYYGSGGFADFIYFHNTDTLKSKDDLRIGQTLRLPPPEGD